jgi:hypothetical protein
MSDFTHEEEYQRIRSFTTQLFSDYSSLTTAVSASIHAQTVETLTQGRRPEQFFFIVNLLDLEIINAVGMHEMGYADSSFTFRQYLNCLPGPGFLQSTRLLSEQIFRMQERFPVRFMREQFIANVPMRHANGQLLLVKRSITPWQHTSTGLITAYLSEFTILKNYEGEPMNPRFANIPDDFSGEFYQAIHQIFANLSARKNPFSPREIDVMRAYTTAADGKRPTAKQVAERTNTTPLTIKDYNKTILAKAKNLFGEDFAAETAFDVAVFLKKNGLLS